jgi:4-amino-4-deoxy-L-arabinose transferase-like glycosyltransferase
MSRSRVFVWTMLVVVFFGAIAPTLSWLEFSSGLENLNVATALELRREHPGSWLIPTLEGEQRIKKPPLATWVTATSVRPATVDAMSSPQERVRHAAAERLAWEARWPALLAGCLILVGVYELGRVLGDGRVGLAAAIICGTSLMFLRFSRYALTDVYLGMFVVWANVFLARAVFLGERWRGMIGTGVMLGLAGMSKGPVGLSQTVLPLLLFVISTRFLPCEPTPQVQRRGWILPIMAGILVMLAVALPWVILVMMQIPDGWRVWWRDISREDVGERPSKWYVYFSIIGWMLPWTVMMVGGGISALRHARAGRPRMLLPVFLVVAPLLIMTFVPDRKERYMYPVIGAAAVLAGHGLVELFDRRATWTGWDKAGVVQHWVLLAIIGVAAPLGEAWWLKDFAIPLGLGAAVAFGAAVAVLAGVLIREQPAGLLAATTLVMLSAAALGLRGYANTEKGRSDMRPLARAIWGACPDAVMYNAHPRGRRVSTDLSIYMNRVTRRITMEDWMSLKPAERPLVTVTIHDKGKPAPTPPAGWRLIAEVPRDEDRWMAFVLDPTRQRN